MKSFIFAFILEALSIQYAWAGPYACIKCPLDDNITQCPNGCNEGEECAFIPRTCTSCQYYECQPIKKSFVNDEIVNVEQSTGDVYSSQLNIQPAMVPCPRCVDCYDCDSIPQFRINCPQVCFGFNPEQQNIEEHDLAKSLKSISKSIKSAPIDVLDNIPEEETTENLDIDAEVIEKKPIKCPVCENCIDCDKNPEYIDACPSVCIVKNFEDKACPTCVGCVDCEAHPEYLQECPEVCKVKEEEDDIKSIVCPDCENCMDCSGRPTLIKYCPTVCMKNEVGEIIDNGGDNDDAVICPTCENCIDCDEHPEYMIECPAVCIDPDYVTSAAIEDEEPSIEEPTVVCPVCKHCVDCNETPIYKDVCPEVCMTEKEIKANTEEKNVDIQCPSCLECIDCAEHPEYIDACPDVCKIETNDDYLTEPIKCPSCVECVDCAKHPNYLIECPTVCKRIITEEEIDAETEGLEEETLAFANAAVSDVDCPKCENCINCNDFPDYLIHCPTVCMSESEVFNVNDEGAVNNEMETDVIEESIDNAVSSKKEKVRCPPCEGCVDCEANPQYLEACPRACHFEVKEDEQRDINEFENAIENEEAEAEEITEEVVTEEAETGNEEPIDLPIVCPKCENCVDCKQHPEFVKACPKVCIAVEEKIEEETEKITEDIIEETEGIEDENEQEQEGDDNVNDDEDEEEITEVFTEKLEEEKDEEEKDEEEKEKEEEEKDENEDEIEVTETIEEITKCPACKECKDCSKYPEFIDACPGACKRDPNIMCPMCMGCLDCSKKPLMKINCPSACGI